MQLYHKYSYKKYLVCSNLSSYFFSQLTFFFFRMQSTKYYNQASYFFLSSPSNRNRNRQPLLDWNANRQPFIKIQKQKLTSTLSSSLAFLISLLSLSGWVYLRMDPNKHICSFQIRKWDRKREERKKEREREREFLISILCDVLI